MRLCFAVFIILSCCLIACDAKGGGRGGGSRGSSGRGSVSSRGSSGRSRSSSRSSFGFRTTRFGSSVVTRTIVFHHVAHTSSYHHYYGHHTGTGYGMGDGSGVARERLPVMPPIELRCIGGTNECKFQPQTVSCYNKTDEYSDGSVRQRWQCESKEMDPRLLCFDFIDIYCLNPTPPPTAAPDALTSDGSAGGTAPAATTEQMPADQSHSCRLEYMIDRIGEERNGTISKIYSACSGNHYDSPIEFDFEALMSMCVVLLITGIIVFKITCWCRNSPAAKRMAGWCNSKISGCKHNNSQTDQQLDAVTVEDTLTALYSARPAAAAAEHNKSLPFSTMPTTADKQPSARPPPADLRSFSQNFLSPASAGANANTRPTRGSCTFVNEERTYTDSLAPSHKRLSY